MSFLTTNQLWQRVNCPLCHADRPTPITRDWQVVAGKPYAFQLVRCQCCGLAYINPQLNRELLTGSAGGGAWHVAAQANQAIYLSGLERLRKLLGIEQAETMNGNPRRTTPRPKLLDVGCGFGAFLAVAQRVGFETAGVEIDRSLAEAARNQGHIVYADYLERLGLPPASFDVITLWDVIEHVPDPNTLVGEAHRLLAPGGILFFHTGNAGFQVTKGRILATLRPERGPYNAPMQHLFHLSMFTARRLLEQAGDFDEILFAHPDTIRYARRSKYLVMKCYNEVTRLLHRVGLPLWTTSLAAFARRAKLDGDANRP